MNLFKHALCLPATILAATLFCAPAHAAIGVTCTVSAGSLTINYDPDATSSTRASANVTFTCSKLIFIAANVAPEIRLSKGSSNGYADRTLKKGNDTLRYNIYTSSSHSLVWGDGTEDTQIVKDSFSVPPSQNSITKTYPYYVELQKEQNVRPGTYTDTITVMVSF